MTETQTTKGLPNVARMLCKSNEGIETITVEIRSENHHPTLYCSRSLQPFLPLPKDEALAEVKLSTPTATHLTLAHRLKGGQRLRFDTMTLEFIAEALSKGESCTLHSGEERLKLPTANFSPCYNRLIKRTS